MRRIGALAGIAVLLTAVGPLGSAPAFGASALPDSATLTSPVVLQGHLTDRSGAALAGTPVLLSAWPSNSTIKALPIGATFRTIPIARTVTDSSGAYTLRSALTPAIAALIDRDGLDLQLDVAHDNRVSTFLTQAVPGGALGWLRPTVDAVAPQSLIASLPGNAFDPLPPDGPHPCNGEFGCEEKPRPIIGSSACVNRKVGVKESPAVVATAVAGYGVTAKVNYTRGAQSSMSTGISYAGAYGGFQANGTRTRGSTMDADFFDVKGTKKAPANAVYQVEMAHAIIAQECNGNKINSYRYRQFMTDPMGTTGGFDKPILIKGPVFKCGKTKPVGGLRAGTVSDKAYTYEKGFTFSPYAGASFTGAATSGYSETVKVDYHFADNGKDNFWCGNSGYPVSPGQRVQAFQK